MSKRTPPTGDATRDLLSGLMDALQANAHLRTPEEWDREEIEAKRAFAEFYEETAGAAFREESDEHLALGRIMGVLAGFMINDPTGLFAIAVMAIGRIHELEEELESVR